MAMDFLWVGNHPGVDLCNTVPVVAGQPVELLAKPADLQRWLSFVAAKPLRKPDERTLRWVREVRELLRKVLVSEAGRGRAIRRLNDALADVLAAPQVDSTGSLVLQPQNAQDEVRLAVVTLVVGACALPPERVRQCAAEKCVLLFFDASK